MGLPFFAKGVMQGTLNQFNNVKYHNCRSKTLMSLKAAMSTPLQNTLALPQCTIPDVRPSRRSAANTKCWFREGAPSLKAFCQAQWLRWTARAARGKRLRLSGPGWRGWEREIWPGIWPQSHHSSVIKRIVYYVFSMWISVNELNVRNHSLNLKTEPEYYILNLLFGNNHGVNNFIWSGLIYLTDDADDCKSIPWKWSWDYESQVVTIC